MRFMTARMVVLSALGFVGCSNSSTNPPSRIDITGQWTLNLTYRNSQRGVSCSSQGVMVGFTQTDSSFIGTVVSGIEVCSRQQDTSTTTTNLVGRTWTNGQISGVSLTSRVGSCAVNANVSGNPANAMTGIITCSQAVFGGLADLTGTWSGTKE